MHADLMLKWIGEMGTKRVGGLVNNNAANISLARELTAATEGFTHILQTRYVGLQNIHISIFSTALFLHTAAQLRQLLPL